MRLVLTFLFGAGFTVAVMLALGKLLLRRLRLRFTKHEDHLFALVSGAACLSLIVFALAIAHGARKGLFLALGLAALVAAFRHRRADHDPTPAPLPRVWLVFFWTVFAVFGYVYLIHAMAPETSPDGSMYHLGLIGRYARAHAMERITTNMYAHLSQGVEMLYLFAYTFGRHSSAALVHLAFLFALPLGMLTYARRFGFPTAGLVGGLLVYLSPIVGYDGSSAYIDIVVACVLFALFYLLQIWDEDRRPGLLILIGLLAGFAYAMKYTAFVAVLYAAAFVAWKTWRKGARLARPLAVFAACAFVMIAPWVARNWIWYGNPLSPFYNNWFPNPYLHYGQEQAYRAQLAEWGGVKNPLEIPVEAAVRGDKLQGLIGPVFLLAPIALLALRYRQGRQLLLAAAVYFVTYPANIGTRFLIPSLPFLSLAMGLVVMNWKAMAPLLVLAHALSAWPDSITVYAGTHGMRIQHVPWKAALRIETEPGYLTRTLYDYPVARLVENVVPPGKRVFTFQGTADAYTTREVLVGYQAAFNNNASELIRAVQIRSWQPTRPLTFKFSSRTLRAVRVVQTAAVADYWSVSELHVLNGGAELPREARWRLRANPNPWEVQFAFDNNPMTRWRTWQSVKGGESMEVDFGRGEQADSVVLDGTPDQWFVKLRLEGRDASGIWKPLAEAPEVMTVPAPYWRRKMAGDELRRMGIDYLLIFDNDLIGPELRANAPLWGATFVGESGQARLYRLK